MRVNKNELNNLGAITFGLDIGIASVGWSVLGENRIINLGVRCFDKAETSDKGESLNLARRAARLSRRRIHHRAWRLARLTKLLKHEGLIPDLSTLRKPFMQSLWHLRVEAMDRQLTSEEWARVIYHLCKHRGFHWTSRAEVASVDADNENGKIKKALSGTKKRMVEKNYRTPAEMVLVEFPDAQRNKQGDYSKAISRLSLGDEFALLFQRQREMGNIYATTEIEKMILGNGDNKHGLFWEQKAALSGKSLLDMLGKCTFEKEEYRAPKASFTAERHVLLTRLNNLRIIVDGSSRELTVSERQIILSMPYMQAGDFTYKDLRNALVSGGFCATESMKFSGLNYSVKASSDEKYKDPELSILVKLPAWQSLRKLLNKNELGLIWQEISTSALNGDPYFLDSIAYVLSVYKEDDEAEIKLRELTLPGAERTVQALLNIRFDKFSSLSLKALRQIVPYMEKGLLYDDAIARIPEYGHHSQLYVAGAGECIYLPSFYKKQGKNGNIVLRDGMDIPRNPVVLRALNQARKVVNALIKEYGSPYAVHIEMARDLSRPLDERRDIEKLQNEFRDRNEKERAKFIEEFSLAEAPKGKEFEKYQLYKEQGAKCAYSIEPIHIDRLFEPGYAEIDHILPYSRSFDDSKNNRVLVLASENQNKGNYTPFEYLDGKNNSDRWQRFVAFVESNKNYRQAKRARLLRKNFGEDEAKGFRERNLNDTRYICKFFKNYIEKYLKLHSDSDTKRCVVLSGQLTSFLRARWGLVKVRQDSDRHHALDAVVVAACNHGMVKRLSDYSRRKELEKVRRGFVNPATGEILDPAMFDQIEKHFPSPFPNFRQEVIARLTLDDPELLRETMRQIGTYSEEALNAVNPLFVSRAPQRRNGGAAHKDTIYTKPRNGHVLMVEDKKSKKIEKSDFKKTLRIATTEEKASMVISRIGVMDKDGKGDYKLTLDKLDDIIDSHRNERMIASLRLWIGSRNEREKAVKAIESSLGRGKDRRKPTDTENIELERLRALPRKPLKSDPNNGPFNGPVIRSVKVNAGKMSGIQIRNGLAAQESLIRVDIFTKEDKFYLIPLYVADIAKKRKRLPDQTANKETQIDNSFDFRFSLYPNDLIKVTFKEKGSIFGYFRGYGGPPNPYNINILLHDRNKNGHRRANNKGEIPSVGIKTALNIEKFNVDVLGRYYPSMPEHRRDLA